jgi:hypothetical protein
MNQFLLIGRVASLTAAVAMAASPGLRAAAAENAAPATTALTSAAQAFRIADVTLDDQGALTGQAVSLQGAPLAGAQAALDDGRQQWSTTTDAEGNFRFNGVRGGNYRVQVGGQTQFCRAWKAGTAPPAANRGLMIVAGQQTILGQYCGSPVAGCGSPVAAGMAGAKELLSNPLVIGGLIAAAIAIPIAVHNADDDDNDPAS